MANKKIEYGKKDILAPGDLDLKNAKVLISIRLDGDVLEAVKSAAERDRKAYQTLINDKLREMFVKQERPIEEKVHDLETLVQKLMDKVDSIEEQKRPKAAKDGAA